MRASTSISMSRGFPCWTYPAENRAEGILFDSASHPLFQLEWLISEAS